MIYIPAFALTGTADFSSIKNELQNLERTIGNLKVPQIKTDVATPNFSNFFSAIDKAEKQATIKIKPEIDNSFMGGLSNSLTGQKGKFSSVGKELGSSLTMGMQQQFGMAGGVASSFASALGPVGVAAGVASVALIGLGAASTKAAMAWEDMKTSIGRTTGLEGANLEDLMSQLQDLRQEMGITAEAASSMVEQAGSIGVGQSKLNAGDVVGYKQEILDFAKATAILQGAWGMSAEATSSGIGKMGSVTLNAWNVQRKARGEEEMSWADYAYKVGGQTDALANAMGSSEEEIVTAMRNSSGAIAKFAPSEETYGKWQAMASFLIDTGSSAGEAGTQIERVAQKMDQNAVDVASVMGIDQATLSANLKTDFMGTIQNLGESIAAMPESARPDTAKMFGLEGKVLIDKVVADIEAGTGKLQNAYDLALNPSNVAEGYEDVADNASKAFDKIGQAFQVSLEKIGGQLLPIVTDVANGIADAWIAANEAGTEIFGAAQQVADNGLEMAINGEEYVLDWSGLHKRTAEEIAAATSEGSTSGLAAGAENAKSAITDSAKSAVEDAYEEVAKSSKEFSSKYGSQYAAGMTYGADYTYTGEDYVDQTTGKLVKKGDLIKGSGAWSSNASRDSFYKQKSLLTDKYSTFANGEIAYDIRKNAASEKADTMTAVISLDGTEYVREFSTLEDTAESATKKIKAEFRDVAIDIPKYIKQYGGDVSDALSNALSDGVVSFEEKNELGEYIDSLKSMKVDFPVEFDQANLDDQLTKLEATRLGLNVDLLLGTDKLESDFYKWAEENADVIATYLANNTSYMEATQGRPEYQWLELNPDAVSLMEEYNAALSSHEPGQVSKLPSLQNDLLKLHPELQDQAFWTTKVNVAQAELNEHFVILGNTVVGIDKDGKAVSEGFQAELPVLAAHGTGLIADAEAVASHTRSVLSSIAAMSNVHYGTLPTSANYALPGTTARAYNAYKPTTPIYAPLESLNLTKFAKGGISLTKGIAEVDANELHIPKDQLPCAVSSMYDVLENPNLFFPSGLGTITDSSGATYPTQAKLESLDKVIDTTKISFESANSGVLKLSSGATYVSDRWMEEYNRFTITAPGTGFQSSSKRGYVPVSISDAAKENIIYNPFTDESNWQASGMDAKIFAMQQQYAGKSSVMPSGANAKPDWIVEASNGVIPKYSEGVLNSLAVEYDSLQAVNTEKVRYADLQGTELRNILMQSDAIIDATAAGGEYCEAMSQFGIVTEETSRLAEKNGMFQKAYIGESKYYEQAKEYFAGNTVTEAINKTTKQVSDVEDAVDESANEYGKYGRKLDALTDGLFATVSVLRGSAQSDLYGDKIPMSQSAKWYMDEFYTVEYGLGQCVSYLSDFAIMQEGVFSDVLFKPSYIGKTAGYAGAGKGGLPGYSNIAEILPQNALEMQEAASRFADAADMTDANYQLSKIGESSEATKEATEESAKELKEVSKNTQQVAEQNAAISDLYGQTVGSSGWGGTSIGGGGGWIGTSGVYSGMNGGVYYGSTVGGIGAQASAAASSGQSSTYGSVQWAEGGITDHPVFGVFGEAGREAFVPISDKAAGRRILPQVMRELGVRTFAAGGIAGSGGLSAIMESIGGNTIAPVYNINGSGLSAGQLANVLEKHDKKLLEQVAKKTVLSKRRRP